MNRSESLLSTFDDLNVKYSFLNTKSVDELLARHDFKKMADTALLYFRQALESLSQFAPHEAIKFVADSALHIMNHQLMILFVTSDHQEAMQNVFGLTPESFPFDLDSNRAIFLTLNIVTPGYQKLIVTHNPQVVFETPVLLFPVEYLVTANNDLATALARALAAAIYIYDYFSMKNFSYQQTIDRQDDLTVALLLHLQEMGVDISESLELFELLDKIDEPLSLTNGIFDPTERKEIIIPVGGPKLN